MVDTSLGAVVIGRNEAAHLAQCLTSLQQDVDHLIYVDSGSTDDSLAIARSAGVDIVELDMSQPFTAARARNIGYSALLERVNSLEYVQFVDGDCLVLPDWITMAKVALDRDETLGIVTGWRSEIYADRSLYNALCQFEWRRPAGDILTCGGDMMVRRTAFDAVRGFDATVIAAEDDEFCVRMRSDGWRIKRLPVEMTRHDAAMTRFHQWWSRAVRSGHGFAQVGNMHPTYFVQERRRVWVYGALLPLFAILALGLFPMGFFAILGIYALSYIRTAKGLERAGLKQRAAYQQAILLTLSKFPNFQGMMIYQWRRLWGHKMNIIEYK